MSAATLEPQGSSGHDDRAAIAWPASDEAVHHTIGSRDGQDGLIDGVEYARLVIVGEWDRGGCVSDSGGDRWGDGVGVAD